MVSYRIRVFSIAVIVMTLLDRGTVAHAQARKMLVLIDASGSMDTARPADSVNTTRFAAAKERARLQIQIQARQGLSSVAVYTFSDTTVTAQTNGFVDPNDARARISALDLLTVGGGSTPLAGSVCDAVDALVSEAPNPSDIRILQLSSDGEENSTPLGHPCQGPSSTISEPPFSGGSWQNLVLNYVIAHGVAPYIDLFDSSPIVGPGMQRSGVSDRDAVASAALRISAPATGTGNLVADRPPSLIDFFAELAREGGGRLTVITDQQAQLPVFGDFTGNSCTDRSDALLVARAFGRTGQPQDNPLDLNGDGRISFSDYALALGGFTPAGCGAPDPYVASAPIACSGGQPVTIDGRAIEAGGITINAQGTCRITIRNSLVVSGQSAIKIQGSAILTIDNSILIGESAVLTTQGSTVLSSASSVFHGTRATRGAFVLIDRGGNTFE